MLIPMLLCCDELIILCLYVVRDRFGEKSRPAHPCAQNNWLTMTHGNTDQMLARLDHLVGYTD